MAGTAELAELMEMRDAVQNYAREKFSDVTLLYPVAFTPGCCSTWKVQVNVLFPGRTWWMTFEAMKEWPSELIAVSFRETSVPLLTLDNIVTLMTGKGVPAA
jgi:hypothetical protein